MTPGNPLQGMSSYNVAQPDLTNQHRIGRNQVRDALVSIGQVRTDSHFPIAAGSHPYQRMLDTCDRLTASEDNPAIDECAAVHGPYHLFRKVLCLRLVQRNLVTLVEEEPHIEQDTVAFVRRPPFAFSFLKQCETAETFHWISTGAI